MTVKCHLCNKKKTKVVSIYVRDVYKYSQMVNYGGGGAMRGCSRTLWLAVYI